MFRPNTIRKAETTDQDFLFEMLYQSIYVPPNTPKPERSILQVPELSKYVNNWGQPGDYGLIALDEKNCKIGAVWLRYFDKNHKGYGYICDDIPELGIAVDSKYRGKGVGANLLKTLLDETKSFVPVISLSVQIENPAKNLYARFGFVEASREGDSIIMRYDHET